MWLSKMYLKYVKSIKNSECIKAYIQRKDNTYLLISF